MIAEKTDFFPQCPHLHLPNESLNILDDPYEILLKEIWTPILHLISLK